MEGGEPQKLWKEEVTVKGSLVSILYILLIYLSLSLCLLSYYETYVTLCVYISSRASLFTNFGFCKTQDN